MPKIKHERNISKMILKGLLYTGGFYIACSSPYFARKALPMFIKEIRYQIKKKRREKAYCRSFYYLLRQRYINADYRGKQIYIALTKEGKKLAGKYQIDNLTIPKPKKWDGRWRILIFDIPDKHKIKREALRGKLKELGLFQLQKSVWICPYSFQNEVEILRNFFNLSRKEMKVILAYAIENNEEAINFFKL